MRSTTRLCFSLLLACAALLSACATTPAEKPNDALSKAEYAIEQAQRKVGQDTQSVPLYQAEKRLGQARNLVAKPDADEADYLKARRLAEEATLDARLAQAQTDAQQAQAQKADLQKSLETLREELHGQEAE